jgi:hypothetical protein
MPALTFATGLIALLVTACLTYLLSVNPSTCCLLFLGAFAKLLKATVSFVMSVRMEQLGFQWTDFD